MDKQEPGTVCCLFYTSGTTGNSKGAMLTHDNMTFFEKTVPPPEGLDDKDSKLVSYLPLSHMAGFRVDVVDQINRGYTIYYARPDVFQGTLVQTL